MSDFWDFFSDGASSPDWSSSGWDVPAGDMYSAVADTPDTSWLWDGSQYGGNDGYLGNIPVTSNAVPGYVDTAPASYSGYQNTASPSLWDLVQQAGSVVESPGGKFMAGLAGAGISAYGANQQNKNNKKAYKKQQEMLAARQAKQAQYDSPLRLVNGRQQLVVPQQRNGEAVFFSNNKLPSYFAEGGGVSEEQYAQMVAEAQQARADAQMDRPSMVGFLRYLANGKRMPSELAAAKRAQRTVPDVIQTRQRKIDEAANYAQGGSPNYVAGGTPGQADKIPAQLSDGEYVMDADVVSALGDGNNAAGAAKLDQMRQNIRAHKRSAPVNKIPPKAKSPLAYMKKGAK